jgi:hypothetical protein
LFGSCYGLSDRCAHSTRRSLLDDGVPNRLERVKEIDQVLLLIRRKTDAEALVIEVHYIHQSGCRTIMEVGRTSSESTQDRSWIETIDFILTHKADDVGRAFRLMSATCSDPCRPAVPDSIRSAYSGCRDQRLPFNERLWHRTARHSRR